jgi:serine/threonine-protein kinase
MNDLSFTIARLNCQVTVTVAEGINFALYQCRTSAIRKLSIHNKGNESTPKARLAIAIEGYSDMLEQNLEPIPAGAIVNLESLPLKLNYTRLEGLETKIIANLKIWIDEDLVWQSTIDILGFYEWPLSTDTAFQKSIACFVQPANPIVQHIVLDAARSLRENTDFVSFKNLLDSEYANKTPLALKTIYESISSNYQIQYVHSPAWSYEWDSQVIRPPHRVLPETTGTAYLPGQGEGTCIDLSLFLAACLENINLQPILIFVQTSSQVLHAFIGCWQNKSSKSLNLFIDFSTLINALEQNHLVLLEATGLSSHYGDNLSYEKAVEKARTYLKDERNFVFAIDISAARENQIFPLQYAMSPAVTGIIRNAEMLALQEKDLRLESRHLLCSFFRSDVENNPQLAAAFSNAGIDLSAIRNRIVSMIEYYFGSSETMGSNLLQKTRNYRHIIAEATVMARESANGLIERVHLLWAILQSSSKGVREILNYAGIDADHLVSALGNYFPWASQETHTYYRMAEHDNTEQIDEAFDRSRVIDFRLCRLTASQFENISIDFELPDQLQAGGPIPGTPFRVGDYIGEEWILLDLLGKGGMGIVYLVLDKPSGEKMALKTIRDELVRKAGIKERFINEAKIWMQISQSPHLNILKIRKIQEIAGRFYIGMEYVPPPRDDLTGSTLRDWLLKLRYIENEQILKWSLQLCAGIAHANELGMKCHGDIRPENIFIDRELNIKLADFGLALSIGTERGFSGPIGSFAYMAPERFASSGPADEITDIYSFGVILFEMVNGRRPVKVESEQFSGIEEQKRTWEAAHRETTRPMDRSPFASIIQKCLNSARSERYRNFREIERDLCTLAQKLGCKFALKDPIPHETSVEAIATRGINFLELRMYKKAMDCFDQALSREGTNLTALNGKGFCLLGLGQLGKAAKIFDRALTQFPNDFQALIGKSATLIKCSHYDPAASCLDRVLSAHPRIAALWYHRADIYLHSGDRGKALGCIYTALELLISQKRKDEAVEIVEHGLSHYPSDLRLLQLQGWIHRLLGPNEEDLLASKQKFEKLFQTQNKTDAETAGLLAGTYKRLWAMNPIQYIHFLQKAFDLYHHAWEASNQKNGYVGINAASVALLLGQLELSRKIAAVILKNIGDRSSYWDYATQAEAELLLGNFGRAGRLYADVMTFDQSKKSYIESSLYQMDLILPRLGITLNAVSFLQKASKSTEHAPRICFGVIGCYQSRYPEKLANQLKNVFDSTRGLLPRKIHYEIMSSLSNISEKIASKILMTEYNADLKIVLPLEVDVYLRNFEEKSEFQWFLNHAEAMTILNKEKAPIKGWEDVHRHMVEKCDILIVISDENVTQEPLLSINTLDYARKTKKPMAFIDHNQLRQTIYENFQEIKKTAARII